jgi:hypothetical protein
MGSFRPGAVLVVALLISATMLAIMPGSANLIAEPGLSAAIDQPSGCPCSGSCGTQPASQDTPAQNTEANAINQQVQPVYSPVSVPQPVENAPAASVPAAVADKPVSVAPESPKNNGIADMMGSFSLTGLKEFMPSRLINDDLSSGTPYNNFWKKMNIQSANVDPVFTGWQKSPVSGMVSLPLQFSFEK